ncbi:hypothetical protein [Bartonella phoceensis]|uniref:hypothetical protein n=1 Tax=Bartonella phoceensis TaxID=270249 RepID=UPI001ABB430A|nr:hypothetical protein [Bartonella phoceensis]
MRQTLKFLNTLLIMIGCYQAQFSQTIAETRRKHDAHQPEKKVLIHGVQEDFQNDPKFIEHCRVFERDPDCNPLESRNPAHFSRNLGHWD